MSYYKIASKNNHQYFNQLVFQTEKSILKRYALYEQALLGGLGLFNASNFVDYQEWKKYVSTLNIDSSLPGINGVGFIENVLEKDLNDFLAKMRQHGPENFRNRPDTEFPDKFIIKYIVPEERNAKAIGLDIGFEANRRAAAEYARDSGKPALTKKIELVQDNKKRAGFLLLIPFYEGFETPEGLVEKRKKHRGWVYAPFIADNFLKDLGYAGNKKLSFTIYDGAEKKTDHIIYQNNDFKNSSKYKKETIINIAGQLWTISWYESEFFSAPVNLYVAYIIALSGFLLSVLTFLFLSFLLRVNHNVSEQVEEKTHQLNKSTQFLSLIMNSIPDPVFVKDRDFKIIKANKAFLDIFSPDKRDKVIGYTTIENFSKEEADLFLKQDRLAFDNGISQIHEKIELYNGKILNIYTTKVKFYDENDKEYILCIGRDVTDLIEVQKNLENTVDERTKKYKEQKQIAEQAGKAKEDFLANMSHELRTPLNSIIGLTKILIDEGKFNQEEEESLSIIDRASHSLLRTVNDILDISKIEAGKVNLDNKAINLSGLMCSIIEQVKPLASQKGLDLRHNLAELKDVNVLADEHRISRIIMNLISNAIKYTNQGYVDVNFDSNYDENDIINVTVRVTDTGIGIPKDQQEGIFDKFSQADRSVERMYGGTGLGLSITKQLVELMAGVLTLESEEGKGSTFTVNLPLAKSQEEDIKEELKTNHYNMADQSEPTKLFSKARILVAEDHEFNQIFVRKILRRLGNNNFKIVENGLDALNEFKREKYDLILMDYHMPRMNGYDATNNIRQYERTKKLSHYTPIIAMTADVMPGTEDKCLHIGMNDYISKPIDESLLKQKIQRWLIFSGSDRSIVSVERNKENLVYLDLTILDQYTDGDVKSKKELIEIFYKKSSEDIEFLKKHCVNGNSDEWVAAAHGLKGSASYIGASKLRNLCSVAQALSNATKEDRLDIYQKIKESHEETCKMLIDLKLLENKK